MIVHLHCIGLLKIFRFVLSSNKSFVLHVRTVSDSLISQRWLENLSLLMTDSRVGALHDGEPEVVYYLRTNVFLPTAPQIRPSSAFPNALRTLHYHRRSYLSAEIDVDHTTRDVTWRCRWLLASCAQYTEYRNSSCGQQRFLMALRIASRLLVLPFMGSRHRSATANRRVNS